mgnify:CR=1 FL=1
MSMPQFDMEKFMAPSKKLAELSIANTERMIALNTEMFTKYTNLVMANAKEALTIADVDGATAYMQKQPEVANNVVESIVADAKVVADLGKEYGENVQKLITEEVSKIKAA